MYITLARTCKNTDFIGFPFMAFPKFSSTYLVVCCAITALSPYQVLLTSLLLYKTPILL